MLRCLFACAIACTVFLVGCSCASDTDPVADDAGPGMMMTDGDVGMMDAGPGNTDGGDIDGAPPDDGGPPPDSATCGVDADGDGVDDCTDCDDTDPNTYPGAPEVCGDGITNDCSMNPPDTGCGGIGTYVAEPPIGMPPPMMPGGPGGLGTQARPVDTIQNGINNAMMIGGGVDVYVAAGNYAEDVVMVEGISLYGGYDATAGWTRDTAVNVSAIDNITAAGVSFTGRITRATELDGFTVNGLSGGGSATAITVMHRCSPVINDNVVNAPNSGGQSNGIHVNPMNVANGANPMISNNEVNLGAARGGWGSSNGAWGIRVQQTEVEVLNNTVTLDDDDTIQRAIEVLGSPTMSVIDGNTVQGNPSGPSDRASGISVWTSNVTVTDNYVDPGRCNTSCTGLATGGPGPLTQMIANNVLFGGAGGRDSTTGLSIGFERVPPTAPTIVVHSNFLHGGSGRRSQGVHIGECPGSQIFVGEFYNNIIYSGTGGIWRFAFVEQHPNIDPDVFENNALEMQSSGSMMAGSIYRNEGQPPAPVGLSRCVPSGGMDLTNAAAVNMLRMSQNNIEDDCNVMNPTPSGDYHLSPGSMCIDAGTMNGSAPAIDFEGDARPMGMGYDIGPDEAG